MLDNTSLSRTLLPPPPPLEHTASLLEEFPLLLDDFAALQGPLGSLWSGASAAANAHLNEVVQLKLEGRFDQGADDIRGSMRAVRAAANEYIPSLLWHA